MKIPSKVLKDTSGQGLVEYTLIVFMVVFVIWIAIKGTTVGVGTSMGDVWTKITSCVAAPFSCG
jgi:Flp pilus assembly pilin Flp